MCVYCIKMSFDYNDKTIVGFYEDAIANVNKRYDIYRGNAANNINTLNAAINDFNRDRFIISGSESDSDFEKQQRYTGLNVRGMTIYVPRLKSIEDNITEDNRTIHVTKILLTGPRSSDKLNNYLTNYLTNTIFFTGENGNLVKAGLVAQKGGRKSRRGKRNTKRRSLKKRRGSSKKRK